MLRDIALPSFGSSIGEATILEWHVAVGSEVEAGQVIAEIETDKAMAELEAPESGTIETIEVAEGGESVAVGTVLATLRPSRPESLPEEAAEPAVESRERIPASPYARKRARDDGLALGDIEGSGPGGRIVSRDLGPARQASTPSTPATQADCLSEYGHAADGYDLKPVSRMRRAIAASLLRSAREIPRYSLLADLAFDTALQYRQAVNSALPAGAAKVSINDVVIWACARALLDVPATNSAWTEDGIACFRHANIASAVATADGLVAPVVRAAETMSVEQIAEATRGAIGRARSGELKAEELQGASFTVSNLGMLGIRTFNSIPAHMQACILSVGSVEPRPVVHDDAIGVQTLGTVTLTCDHRVVDGASGAQFLKALAGYLNAPSGWKRYQEPS